jgi:pyruvate/2-oxoglutarate dehydrogenase complex dihydrolipoamide acyltransferase (E2) component
MRPPLVLALLHLTLPRPSGSPDIADLFRQLDTANGGNGQLSKLELRRAASTGLLEQLGLPGDDALLAAADRDANSMVSEVELQDYLATRAPLTGSAAPPSELDGAAPRAFRKHTSCEPCVAAGFGWSTRLGKCGGYANKACDEPPLPPPPSPPAPSPSPSPTPSLTAEERRLRQQLDAALSLVDDVLAQSGSGGAAAGDDVDAKVARARQLVRTDTARQGANAAACPAAGASDSREEWRPSASQLGNWMPKISPFAWTPIWSAPTSSALDLDALRAYIYEDRKTNAGLSKSNDGGFHSQGDLLESGTAIRTPVLREFRKEIYRYGALG